MLVNVIKINERATGWKTGCSAQIKNLSQSFTIRSWKVGECMLSSFFESGSVGGPDVVSSSDMHSHIF